MSRKSSSSAEQTTRSLNLRRCMTLLLLFLFCKIWLVCTRHAHDALTSFMSKHGFNVTPHYHLPTAWMATYTHGDGGQRTIGINSEMDALPGIGHACGHNLIGMAGVAVACAIKTVMQKFSIPGKIVLLGTPGILPIYAYIWSSWAKRWSQVKKVASEKTSYLIMALTAKWTHVLCWYSSRWLIFALIVYAQLKVSPGTGTSFVYKPE